MGTSTRFWAIMLSNTGVTPPTAKEGYPRPRIPSNSASTKVWPGSVTLSPNCWPTTVSPSTWWEKAQGNLHRRSLQKGLRVLDSPSVLKLILLQLKFSWLNGHNDFCHSQIQFFNVKFSCCWSINRNHKCASQWVFINCTHPCEQAPKLRNKTSQPPGSSFMHPALPLHRSSGVTNLVSNSLYQLCLFLNFI